MKDDGVGYVTRFAVRSSFMRRYEIQKVGGDHHTEWWVPAEELEELNKNIVGLIEVIGELPWSGITSRWFRLAPAKRRCSRHSGGVRHQNQSRAKVLERWRNGASGSVGG